MPTFLSPFSEVELVVDEPEEVAVDEPPLQEAGHGKSVDIPPLDGICNHGELDFAQFFIAFPCCIPFHSS